jgi:hypothetical protein
MPRAHASTHAAYYCFERQNERKKNKIKFIFNPGQAGKEREREKFE